MTGPEGNSEFCFPQISMFPETIRFTVPHGASHHVNCYIAKQNKTKF